VSTPGGGAAAGDTTTLALVAYSTPREVYAQLTKDFAATEAGAGVSFQESYASSGEQSRAVGAGLPADVVAFSLEPHCIMKTNEVWRNRQQETKSPWACSRRGSTRAAA